MSKITLNNVSNLQDTTTSQNTINGNNSTVVTAFDNTLSRDGTQPNQMQANLDMNSNHILNLPAPMTSTEPLRLTDANTLNGGGTITVSSLPTGGITGAVLTKNSSSNFDASWLVNSGSTTVKSAPYNAVGDGVTDDTAALQAMIDASAPGHLTVGGGAPINQKFPVILPPGTYKITAGLNATNITNFTMIGQGSGTTFASLGPTIFYSGGGVSGPSINAMLDMTGSCATGHLENLYFVGPIADSTFASYPTLGILMAATVAGGQNFCLLRNVSVQGRFGTACLYVYGVSNSLFDMCGFTNVQQFGGTGDVVVLTASNATYGITSAYTTITTASNAGGSDILFNRCEAHGFTGGATVSPKAYLLEGPLTNYTWNSGVSAAANGFVYEIKGGVNHVTFDNHTFYTDQGPQATVAIGSAVSSAVLSNLLVSNCFVATSTGLYSMGGSGSSLNGVCLVSTIPGVSAATSLIAGLGTSASINGNHI